MENKNLKNIWLGLVVVAVLVLGWWWWSQRVTAPTDEEVLERELNALDLGNVEAELNTTDTDINSL
jgi:cytoskeletal protein RodZ